MAAITGAGTGAAYEVTIESGARVPQSGQNSHLDGRAAMTALFACAAVVALIGRLAHVEALTLIGILSIMIVGVGSAPLQLTSRPDFAARLGLSTLIGFSVAVGGGALMADIRPLWHPAVASIVVAAAAVLLHLYALRTSVSIQRPRPREIAAAARGSVGSPRSVAYAVLLLGGTTIWLVAALAAGHISPKIGGFPTQISPVWFAGVILLLVCLPLAGKSGTRLGAAVSSLGLATTLTPALVYGSPRSQSAEKQIELVQLILRHHHIVPGAGIYQAYSAFFAGIAWICHASRVSDPFGLATYWPVVMVVVRLAELRFLIGRIVISPRRRWYAVALVILVDSIGADYFSPQSLGYVVVIGMLALVVKGRTARPLGTWATLIVLAVGSLMLAPEHELSPFIAAGAMFALAIFGEAPFWAFAVAALPAFGWVALEYHIVRHEFSFSQIFAVSNFSPPKTVSTPGLERMPIVGLSSHALFLGIVVLIVLALWGFLTHWRERRMWGYGLCVTVGLGFVAINPYGNEGIFRAALFGIPWLAVMAASIPLPARPTGLRRWLSPTGAGIGMSAVSVGLFATFVVGAFGLDSSDVLRRADRHATELFVAQSPPGSEILTVGYGDAAANGPLFAGEHYSLTWSQVVTPNLVRPSHPTPGDVPLLDAEYEQAARNNQPVPPTQLYLLWSPSLRAYSHEYGLQSPAQADAWLRLLRVSPRWRLVFSSDGSYLFRLRDGPGGVGD